MPGDDTENATQMRNLLIYKYIDATVRAGSVRKAAEILAITPSSLNRRIQSLEEELGTPLFERHAKGVRLNPAGEQVLHAFRKHLAEIDALKARIEDLKGARLGTVSIVCSQSLLPTFLPQQIQTYRTQFPGVEFKVHMADGEAAESALMNYDADLAIVFSPLALESFETIATTRQRIFAIMSESHKLAKRKRLKLIDCLDFPLALPRGPYALRLLLDVEAKRLNSVLRPAVETESYIFLRNYIAAGDAIGFEIEMGLPIGSEQGIASRPVDLKSSSGGLLHIAHLRGRTLPVGAAKFAQQIANCFEEFSG